MKLVKQVIFRYLTNADFFNINKPSGTEEGGGPKLHRLSHLRGLSIRLGIILKQY